MEQKLMFNKKALSEVVMTVIMIALTLVVVSIVWLIVQGIIKAQTDKAKECFNDFGKLTLDAQYTCFNVAENKFYFLIKRGDIDLEQILVGISNDGDSEEIYINETNENYLLMNKDSGKKYSIDLNTKPILISIFPIVNNRQCQQADSINQINEC